MKMFLLYHSHALEDSDDDFKLIGVYSSEQKAQEAIERVSKSAGFRDFPDGFFTDEYTVDEDNWTDGFVTMVTVG